MTINGCLWLEDIVEKLEWKPNVFIDEVEYVLEDNPCIRFVEKGHVAGEMFMPRLVKLRKGGI